MFKDIQCFIKTKDHVLEMKSFVNLNNCNIKKMIKRFLKSF